MARVTREDVARAANVSGTTVSRVLSGKADQIGDETQRRVHEAAARLGYIPNPAAKALLTGRTQLVGLWMCLGYSRYRSHVLDRMRTILAQTDFAIAVTDVEEDLFWRHSMARALRVGVDGILAFDTPTAGDAFARTDKNQAGTTPLVGMGAYWSEATSYVGVDLGAGVAEAMRHLFEIGHRDVAYLYPGDDGTGGKEARLKAYLSAMAAIGREPILIPGSGLTIGEAQRNFGAYLGQASTPRALLCFNDEVAIGASQALIERNLYPGIDVAIVGCDGIDETALLPFPLTTIAQPVDEMCALAWEFLRERIDDPAAAIRQQILRPQLVVRASTRA